MNKHYVCGITIFRPDITVVDRIHIYVSCFEKVYIFDNTEEEFINNQIINSIKSLSNVFYYGDGHNHGLPYAFNYIISLIPIDVNFICTLDQDSDFPAEEIKSIVCKINSITDDNKYGIIAPHIQYDLKSFVKTDRILNVRYVITSGSFVSLDVLRKHKIVYDEAYFIDKFEIDLGEQIKQKGLLIGQYQGAVLYQRLGELDSKGRINHSALRHYYLFRNRFYFNNKFYHSPLKQILSFFQTIKHICKILFHEIDKHNKLSMLPIAYSDYRNRNFGQKCF